MTTQLPDPDRVAEVARAVAGVVDLTGGPLDSAATYLPGRRVPGVRLDESTIAVHLVVTMERPVREVAADVHRALGEAFAGRTVEVVIEDVSVDGEGPPADEGTR